MAGAAQALRVFVAHYGLVALFVLLVIEEAGVWLPLPGDLFVMYFGYRASQSPVPLVAVLPALLTVTAAVVCGSLILYSLTRRFRLRVRRLGRVVHLDEQRLARMDGWIRRHGARMVVPGRLIPGLRIPTTVVAGLFDLPVRSFVPAVTAGALVWGGFYLALGGLGSSLLPLVRHVHTDEPLPDAPGEWLAVLVILAAITGLAMGWRERRHGAAGSR